MVTGDWAWAGVSPKPVGRQAVGDTRVTHPCMYSVHSSSLEFLELCIDTDTVMNSQYLEKAQAPPSLESGFANQLVSLGIASHAKKCPITRNEPYYYF